MTPDKPVSGDKVERLIAEARAAFDGDDIVRMRIALSKTAHALADAQAGREASREVAEWMIANDYATGHGDTIADMLGELEWQAKERASLSGAWVIVGPDMRWAQVQRLRFIGHLIETKGRFNRSDLKEKFGISEQQASSDIAHFMRWNPGRSHYDSSAKCHVAEARAFLSRTGAKT